MRVLFVSAWCPCPPSNGSRQRVHHLLRALADAYEVHLISFADASGPADLAAARALCREVEVIPAPVFDRRTWRARLALLDPRPRSLAATFSPAMAGAIARAAPRCDVAVASQLACAAYAPYLADRPALFEEVELGWLHGLCVGAHPLRRWRAALTWQKYRHYLRRLMPRFAACTVVSEPERVLLGTVLGSTRRIHLLPNGVAGADYVPPDPRPDTVIFAGSLRYGPNHEAMRWFVGRVWPRVLAERPNARLFITGAHDDRPLPAAAHVERVGFVADLRPLLGAAWLAVAPIHTGGGTRVKILEAMAAGVPVVATAKGAEGLEATPGEHLLVADDPDDFAARVLVVLNEPLLRARLAAAARALVGARYDWRILGPRFAALVRAVAEGRATDEHR